MIRRFALLSLFLLAASSAFAQNADLATVIKAPATVDAGQGFSWTIDVVNNGTVAAHNVGITGSSEPALGTDCSTTADTILPGSHATLICETQALGANGDIVLHAHAGYPPDPRPADNDATQTVHAIVGPDIMLGMGIHAPVDPELPFNFVIYWENTTHIPASNATLTLAIPAGLVITNLPPNCTESEATITCSTGPIPAYAVSASPYEVIIGAVADDSTNGERLPLTGDIKAVEPEGNLTNNHLTANLAVYRTFFVKDTQPDSLPNAIDQANLACTDDYPCKIAFRLGTPPESGYFTLRPERALPKITGKNISIDGTTQTHLTGDTNPNGPEIFIDGSNNAWEDAIVFDEPCAVELTGVAIGNFKNAAVTLNGTFDPVTATVPCTSPFYSRIVHENYLGVDPTGTRAAANGRGIVINENLFSPTFITKNLISGNLRSGIWAGVSFRNEITDNTIGIDIHHQPLANGASGIYISRNGFDLDIRGNYVAFNHDFGIAVDRSAIGTDIGPNSIYANLQPGIDVGLDGPTPDRDVPAPVVLSAQYNPATQMTVLTIASNEPPSIILPTLIMYASDAPHPSGYGDGQYFLGALGFNSTQGNVQFAAPGDWRGKWVAATVTRNNFFGFLRTNAAAPRSTFPDTHSTTSEFSRAVAVE